MIEILNKLICKGWAEEVRFHPIRRWRFDFANVRLKVAIEVEGGVFVRGRHVTGLGFTKDMEKYNSAVILGWRILRYTPQQIRQGKYINDLKELLNGH